MGRVVRVKSGRASITLSGPDAADVEREILSCLGAVANESIRLAEEVKRQAQETWPIKSGTSRDMLAVALLVTPAKYRAEAIVIGAEYARFIKSTKRGRERDAVRIRRPVAVDLGEPGKVAKKALRMKLPAILADDLRRRLLHG